MEPFSYTNKNGVTYYLHAVRGSDGRTYHVMTIREKGAAPRLPQGFEIRETVHGQVVVRRVRPSKSPPWKKGSFMPPWRT